MRQELTTATIWIALATAGTMLCASGAAADGVPVPNRIAPGAAFAPSGKPVAGNARGFVAQGADGARMVAFEAALLTAVIGSRVELAASQSGKDEPPARVSLLEGACHVVSGSKPVELKIGETTLRTSEAELIVARLGQSFVVQVLATREGGNVDAAPAESPKKAEPPPDPAIDEQDPVAAPSSPAAPPQVHVLEPGARYAISSDGVPRPADRREAQFLDKISERLLPEPVPQAPLIEPRQIEDPRDFTVRGSATDATMADIELEDIEVEVGCVEICVD